EAARPLQLLAYIEEPVLRGLRRDRRQPDQGASRAAGAAHLLRQSSEVCSKPEPQQSNKKPNTYRLNVRLFVQNGRDTGVHLELPKPLKDALRGPLFPAVLVQPDFQY